MVSRPLFDQLSPADADFQLFPLLAGLCVAGDVGTPCSANANCRTNVCSSTTSE